MSKSSKIRYFLLSGLISSLWGTPEFLIDPPTEAQPESIRFIWKTEPGVRYDLWTSGDLSKWTRPNGFPRTASGLADTFQFPKADQHFFRLEYIDEQPPRVIGHFPSEDGFAVGRFAEIVVELTDSTGIDPESIQFSVGSLGNFTTVSPALSFVGNTLTFSLGGDTPVGNYGEVVVATLVVKDPLGNSLTYSWEFTLETAPQLVEDLFVFGSPDALRAGQEVAKTPTRLLVSEPIRTSGSSDSWSLSGVEPDRVIIDYTGSDAPAFNTGTHICNRTPASLNEIFYRQIIDVVNDTSQEQLTLMTEDVTLDQIIVEGAFSSQNDGTIFEVGENGVIQRAIQLDKDIPVNMGFSLDGTTFAMENLEGLELVSVYFEELNWALRNGLFSISVDIGLFDGLRRTEGIYQGDIESAFVFDAEALLAGDVLSDEIWDLPSALEPTYLVPLGPVGFALLQLDAKLRAEAKAKATVSIRGGYRQKAYAEALGWRYEKPDFRWYSDVDFDPTDVVPLTSDFSGDLSVMFKLQPSLSFLLYGAAGGEIQLDGGAGVELATDANDILTGTLLADVDLKLKPGGPLLDWIRPQPSLSWDIWSNDWELFTDAPASAPLKVLTHPKSTTVQNGGFARFSASANKPNASFQWHHEGIAIPSQTGAILDITDVAEGKAGQYQARIQSGNETVWSDAVNLVVANNQADVATYFQYPIDLESSDAWYVSQDFEEWNADFGGYHSGEDWSIPGAGDVGEDVFPVANGIVASIRKTNASLSSGGWTIVVRHQLADSLRKSNESEFYYSVYSHISPRADGTLPGESDRSLFPYQVGKSVSMNRRLAYIADIEAPHLHLEIRKKVRELSDSTLLYLNGTWSTGAYAVDQETLRSEGLIDPSEFLDAHGAGAISDPTSADMVEIPAGTYMMGDSFDEGFSDELPVHKSYVSSFYIGRTEVTYGFWQHVSQWAIATGTRSRIPDPARQPTTPS